MTMGGGFFVFGFCCRWVLRDDVWPAPPNVGILIWYVRLSKCRCYPRTMGVCVSDGVHTRGSRFMLMWAGGAVRPLQRQTRAIRSFPPGRSFFAWAGRPGGLARRGRRGGPRAGWAGAGVLGRSSVRPRSSGPRPGCPGGFGGRFAARGMGGPSRSGSPCLFFILACRVAL